VPLNQTNKQSIQVKKNQKVQLELSALFLTCINQGLFLKSAFRRRYNGCINNVLMYCRSIQCNLQILHLR